MNATRKIELLAPAKNADVGIAAVNHGADAVYIGAPQFSARQNAANSIGDIARLVDYAHRYYARVYVALNTILTDAELEQSRLIISDLYNAGIDALIVQDMGLLELDLPPIPLHASTQCDIRTAEKVRFLEQCGFEQVVLARELSLNQIRNIASQTSVALECFVHGALCVSYSGQCYLSQALRQRSANRGACAQMCRLPYTLCDANGHVLSADKHLLSLKDFDASAHLAELLDAGISSFKIEGRLKDENYVKNITAYYRQKLDNLLENRQLKHASSGTTRFFFEPNPQKTFYRGATDYFLCKRRNDIASFDSPKSFGEPIGRVKQLSYNWLEVDSAVKITNGDGLCAVDTQGEMVGFRINRVEQQRLFPFKMPKISVGTALYRNKDVAFEKILAGKTSERKVAVVFSVSRTNSCLVIAATDEDANGVSVEVPFESLAQNAERMRDTIRTQLSRLGDSIFVAKRTDIQCVDVPFVPVSHLAEARRKLISDLEAQRQTNYPHHVAKTTKTTHAYPQSELDYRANVSNSKAEMFYERHGAKVLQHAFEVAPTPAAELMRTKYCLRYQMGWCPKQHHENQPLEPLVLKCGSADLQLAFDCKNCEMVVRKI